MSKEINLGERLKDAFSEAKRASIPAWMGLMKVFKPIADQQKQTVKAQLESLCKDDTLTENQYWTCLTAVDSAYKPDLNAFH
ncbi:MAG: hypothetical protein KDJ35_04765 [Alphaproteobacteria bacterium]|nr:hypothetical protein [Alphaproteobacteria bacterium]